jgi:hypothetical protein
MRSEIRPLEKYDRAAGKASIFRSPLASATIPRTGEGDRKRFGRVIVGSAIVKIIEKYGESGRALSL